MLKQTKENPERQAQELHLNFIVPRHSEFKRNWWGWKNKNASPLPGNKKIRDPQTFIGNLSRLQGW